MLDTSVFWLRVAALLYAIGFVHSLVSLVRRHTAGYPLALGAFVVGVILHMVSLVDRAFAVGHFPADNFFETISVCGFLLGTLFLFAYFRYEIASLSLILFPLVFLLTLVGVMGTPIEGWGSGRVRGAWLAIHVILIMAGYASILIAAAASIFYLVQEKLLKEKRFGAAWLGLSSTTLPALMTLDTLLTRAMGLGFICVTLGVLTGSAWAFVETGTSWIADPKIVISLITWAVYLALMYLRANNGWRGRKAALMTISLLVFSAVTWAAHVGLKSNYLPVNR